MELASSDSRFSHNNFQSQPQWVIRQAIATIETNRNMNSYTQARFLQSYYNCHLPENAPAADDLSLFMPHPNQWIIQTSDRKVNIDRKTATLFLRTYQEFGTEVVATFDSWIRDLELIASGA